MGGYTKVLYVVVAARVEEEWNIPEYVAVGIGEEGVSATIRGGGLFSSREVRGPRADINIGHSTILRRLREISALSVRSHHNVLDIHQKIMLLRNAEATPSGLSTKLQAYLAFT